MIHAVIFDLDGLLIDSEPLWRRAEVEVFARVGVELTEQECEETTGLRIDEVVAHRHAQTPWPEPSIPEVAGSVIERMVELILSEGRPLPGVAEALATCERAGVALGLASSSSERLIAAALERLGLVGQFSVVASAEHEAYGKPHPAVFLRAAERLGHPPTSCLVVEDSFNGVLAAKAARMTCIAVPDPQHASDPRFAIADRVLHSLAEIRLEDWL